MANDRKETKVIRPPRPAPRTEAQPVPEKVITRETKPAGEVVGRSLTGSGALQIVQQVAENPAVAAATGAAVGATAHKLLNRPKQEPKPQIWTPPSASKDGKK